MITKKKQIEIIIDELKKLYQTTEKINKLFNAECERFDSLYNIGFEIIPTILGIEDETIDDELGELFMNYCYGTITKNDYFNKIDKYLEEDQNKGVE